MADPDRSNDGTSPRDATTRMPPVDGSADPDRTTALPPQTGNPAQPTEQVSSQPENPRWSARANVPPAGTRPRQSVPRAWEEDHQVEEDPYGGRSWFTPVIVGVVVMVLVAALGFGVYLIYKSTTSDVTAGQSPSVTASSAPAPSSAPPATSAAPSPTPPATTEAAPTGIAVPILRGQRQKSATDALDELGLNWSVRPQVDPTVEPGRVIGTDPDAGTFVDAGSTVTVIVSVEASPSPSSSRSGGLLGGLVPGA
jgi:hypothetical protein